MITLFLHGQSLFSVGMQYHPTDDILRLHLITALIALGKALVAHPNTHQHSSMRDLSRLPIGPFWIMDLSTGPLLDTM